MVRVVLRREGRREERVDGASRPRASAGLGGGVETGFTCVGRGSAIEGALGRRSCGTRSGAAQVVDPRDRHVVGTPTRRFSKVNGAPSSSQPRRREARRSGAAAAHLRGFGDLRGLFFSQSSAPPGAAAAVCTHLAAAAGRVGPRRRRAPRGRAGDGAAVGARAVPLEQADAPAQGQHRRQQQDGDDRHHLGRGAARRRVARHLQVRAAHEPHQVRRQGARGGGRAPPPGAPARPTPPDLADHDVAPIR